MLPCCRHLLQAVYGSGLYQSVKGRFHIAERHAQIDKYKRPLARQATTEGDVPEAAKWMDESRVGGCGHYHARSVPFYHRIGRLPSVSQKQTTIVQCGSFQLVAVTSCRQCMDRDSSLRDARCASHATCTNAHHSETSGIGFPKREKPMSDHGRSQFAVQEAGRDRCTALWKMYSVKCTTEEEEETESEEGRKRGS